MAAWWGQNKYDLKALAAGGFERVIEGWTITIEAMLAPEEGPDGKVRQRSAVERRKAFDHKLVPHLLPEFLKQLQEVEAKYAEADAAYKAALAASESNHEIEEETEEPESAEEVTEAYLYALRKKRSAAQRKRTALEKTFLAELNTAIAALTLEQQRDLVLDILDEDLAKRLDTRIETQRGEIVYRFQTWSEKYAISLDQLEDNRNSVAERLKAYFEEHGYA